MAVLAVGVITTGNVSAQTIDLGGGAPSIDLRSGRQRERDFEREEMRRDREIERRRAERSRDRELSGSRGGRCRDVTVREQDEFGRTVTRRSTECR